MNKFYAVVNTEDPQNPTVVTFWNGNLFEDSGEAKEQSSRLNRSMKPEFQTYTVATIILDPEV